jgi:hypothetical protein
VCWLSHGVPCPAHGISLVLKATSKMNLSWWGLLVSKIPCWLWIVLVPIFWTIEPVEYLIQAISGIWMLDADPRTEDDLSETVPSEAFEINSSSSLCIESVFFCISAMSSRIW